MKRQTKWQILSLALVTMLTVVAAGPFGTAKAAPVTAYPPGSGLFGRTFSEWSNAWWQWAFSVPYSTNPVRDATGENCGLGQSGSVWFLAGIFNDTGTALRTRCVIPANKALFIPILNTEESNVEALVDGVKPNLAGLRGRVLDALSGADTSSLLLEVDGVAIPNVANYRVSRYSTLEGYGYNLPEGNMLQSFGYTRARAGTCFYPTDTSRQCVDYLAASDGWYVMIPPLSPGTHTIHIHGSIPGAFTLDVTYNPLTVSGQ